MHRIFLQSLVGEGIESPLLEIHLVELILFKVIKECLLLDGALDSLCNHVILFQEMRAVAFFIHFIPQKSHVLHRLCLWFDLGGLCFYF